MAKQQGIALAVIAITIYLVGGVATFCGLALVVFMNGHDFMGWGDGRSVGWLFLCVGLCLSIAGVLLMRMFRTRGML